MVGDNAFVGEQYKTFRKFLNNHKNISKFENSPVYHYNKTDCQFIVLLNGGTAFNKILKNKNLDAFTINTFDTDIVILTNNCGVTELLNDFGVSLLNVKMTSDVKRQLFRYYIESYEQDSEPTQDHIEPVSLSVQAPYIDITIKTWDPILEYLKDENKSGDLINTFSNSDFVVVYLMFLIFDLFYFLRNELHLSESYFMREKKIEKTIYKALILICNNLNHTYEEIVNGTEDKKKEYVDKIISIIKKDETLAKYRPLWYEYEKELIYKNQEVRNVKSVFPDFDNQSAQHKYFVHLLRVGCGLPMTLHDNLPENVCKLLPGFGMRYKLELQIVWRKLYRDDNNNAKYMSYFTKHGKVQKFDNSSWITTIKAQKNEDMGNPYSVPLSWAPNVRVLQTYTCRGYEDLNKYLATNYENDGFYKRFPDDKEKRLLEEVVMLNTIIYNMWKKNQDKGIIQVYSGLKYLRSVFFESVVHSQPPFIITHRPFLSTSRCPKVASRFGRFILILTVNTGEVPCVFVDRNVSYEDDESIEPFTLCMIKTEEEVLFVYNTSILVTKIEEVDGNILLYGKVLRPDLYSISGVPNYEVHVSDDPHKEITYEGGRSSIMFSTVLTGLLVLCAAAFAPTLM